MKWILLSVLIFTYQVIADEEPYLLPEEAIGVLEVNDMTSGQLLWLRGRVGEGSYTCLLYTSPSPRDLDLSRMPSSA